MNKLLIKVLIAALLVASMALNPKFLHPSAKSPHLRLSEKRKTESEGATIQVNCSADVSKSPDVLMWDLGQDDKPNVNQLRLSNTTVALQISSLKRTNAGQYSCVLVMPDGVEEKEEFQLFVQQANAQVCAKYQFKCKETKICLFIRYRCDNKDDCGDGSDEQCDVDPCLNKFRCNNSRCVDHKFVCDHVDHCGDLSDEHKNCNVRVRPTSTAQPVSDDSQYAWLQITVSTFIAVTLGLVFLISFIVIMVVRVRVRRQREQRIARALERMYNQDGRMGRPGDHPGGPGEPPLSGPGQTSDQQQFLLGPSQPHYGNIIVNVNNGVQYIPGYDYAVMMDVPPPYSEVGTGGGGEPHPPPPPYSTLEHQNMSYAGGNPSHSSVPQDARGVDSPSSRQHQRGQRSGTLPARDMRAREPVSRANAEIHQGSSPRRGGDDPASMTQTLPPGVNINSHFLQSLLGPHPQPPLSRGSEGSSSDTAEDTSLTQGHRDDVEVVHLSASPAPPRRSWQESQNAAAHGQSHDTNSQSHTTPQHIHPPRPTGQLSPSNRGGIAAAAAPPPMNEPLATPNGLNQDFSEDECSQALLHHESEECCDRARVAEDDDEEDALAPQNEDGTFLLRKPKHKIKQERSRAEPDAPLPPPSPSSSTPLSSPQGKSLDGASNALLSEVSKRDDRLRPKPGHLSVQKGEILLHTPTGVLVDPPQQASPSHRMPALASDSDSPDAPELTLQNGALVFGSPKSVSPSAQNSHPPHSPGRGAEGADTTFSASHQELEPESSSQTQSEPGGLAQAPAAVCGPDEQSDTLRRKELQFKNGELVLESPKHTTSTQILSHLKGAYAEQDGMEGAIEPVGNTRRTTAGTAVAKPQMPKFNSDVVLPPKNHP